MRHAWAGSLGIALGVWAGEGFAEDTAWRPAAVPAAARRPGSPPPVALGPPVPLAGLGKPVASTQPAPLTPVTRIADPFVVRAQAPEVPPPVVAGPPPAVPGPSLPPGELYNHGVVTEPPASGGFWKGC